MAQEFLQDVHRFLAPALAQTTQQLSAATEQAHIIWTAITQPVFSQFPSRIDPLGGFARSGIQQAIGDSIQDWFIEHPMLNWFLNHPFLTIGLGLVAILLLQGLLRAIGHFTEQIWLLIFRAPIQLTQQLLKLLLLPFQPKTSPGPPSLEAVQPEQKERLAQLLNQLETLKQEQDKLLKEVKMILNLHQSES